METMATGTSIEDAAAVADDVEDDSNGDVAAAPTTPAATVEPPSAATTTTTTLAVNKINWALLDPPRFGWAALGGIVDMLTPHEVRPNHAGAFLRVPHYTAVSAPRAQASLVFSLLFVPYINRELVE